MEKKKGVLAKVVQPIIPVFSTKDILQVLIGASILAVPVGFTEETWKLGQSLPMLNVLSIMALSIIFIATFIHYTHYKHTVGHRKQFYRRVIATYVVSFLVVSIIMTLIQRAPWTTDLVLAFKRIAIVTFPATMSAAIADTLK